MIYFTTFIFTLLLAHIARAVPQVACGYASPQEQYYTTYDDREQLVPTFQYPNYPLYPIKVDDKFDAGGTDSAEFLTCKSGPYGPLGSNYSTFGDFPSYPYIGGAIGAAFGFPSCGRCWKLRNGCRFIYLLAVDEDQDGFSIGRTAFQGLTGEPSIQLRNEPPSAPEPVTVEAIEVPYYFCGLPGK